MMDLHGDCQMYENTPELHAFYEWFYTFPRVSPSKALKRRQNTPLGPSAKSKLKFLASCNENGYNTSFELGRREPAVMKEAKVWKTLIKCGYVEVKPSILTGIYGRPWLCFKLLSVD